METSDVLALDVLSGLVLHDIKNELHLLGLTLENAYLECPSETLAQACEINDQMVGRLHQLLVLYKAKMGELVLHASEVDCGEFLEELRAELPLGGSKPVSWEFSPDADRSPWVFDSMLIDLVLRDALRNAQRYAESMIVVRARACADGLLFEISDDGPGFPGGGEVLAEGRKQSTGLGLVFAEFVARMHKNAQGVAGSLTLANDEVLGGAVFRLILPHGIIEAG